MNATPTTRRLIVRFSRRERMLLRVGRVRALARRLGTRAALPFQRFWWWLRERLFWLRRSLLAKWQRLKNRWRRLWRAPWEEQ